MNFKRKRPKSSRAGCLLCKHVLTRRELQNRSSFSVNVRNLK